MLYSLYISLSVFKILFKRLLLKENKKSNTQTNQENTATALQKEVLRTQVDQQNEFNHGYERLGDDIAEPQAQDQNKRLGRRGRS